MVKCYVDALLLIFGKKSEGQRTFFKRISWPGLWDTELHFLVSTLLWFDSKAIERTLSTLIDELLERHARMYLRANQVLIREIYMINLSSPRSRLNEEIEGYWSHFKVLIYIALKKVAYSAIEWYTRKIRFESTKKALPSSAENYLRTWKSEKKYLLTLSPEAESQLSAQSDANRGEEERDRPRTWSSILIYFGKAPSLASGCSQNVTALGSPDVIEKQLSEIAHVVKW